MDKNKILRLTGTPLTIFSSLIVLISGLLMFFKVKNHTLEELHSQIGIVFVIGTILHLYINWRPLINHLKKVQSYFVILPIIIIAINLLITPTRKKPEINPGMLFKKLETSSISTVSLLFKTDPSKVLAKLNSEGIKTENTDQTIEEISKHNHKNPREILSVFASF